MAQDPYKYFRPEARDLVDQFAKGILDLEKGASEPATVQQLLRLAHTLKGAARIVKQAEIADRAHAIEGTLTPYRDFDRRHRTRADRYNSWASRRDQQPDCHAGARRGRPDRDAGPARAR